MTDAQVSSRQIIAVVGPTGSGKSDLGIALALRFGGEIVNCDSVQVYRGIEVATAKVPEAARRGVPHHLIDVVGPWESYTAGDWARDAVRTIDEIEERGNTAFLVGGSGFYLRALREPFFESEPTNDALRRRLAALRETRGPEHLHRLLTRLDPEAAVNLAPRDWSRVQRGLEVRIQTGVPLSAQRDARPAPPPHALRLRILALNPPRAELYDRIDARTEAHFSNGLVEEVRRLLDEGVPAMSSALGAHGYRRVVEYLRGERTLESAVAQTKLDVRHYAKRQLTWFRREPDVEWIDGFGDQPSIQEQVASLLDERK